MDIISTVKPDISKKPEVKLEYNNRSYESYIKNGFADNIPRSIRGPHDRMQKFLSLVDLRKGPIERTVTTIIRLKAPSTKKNERKECVYYFEDWTGNDWLGIPINSKWIYSLRIAMVDFPLQVLLHVKNAMSIQILRWSIYYAAEAVKGERSGYWKFITTVSSAEKTNENERKGYHSSN